MLRITVASAEQVFIHQKNVQSLIFFAYEQQVYELTGQPKLYHKINQQFVITSFWHWY